MVVNPQRLLRNVFQVFNDMVQDYVGAGVDEYSGDPESINYVNYDCSRLFVENTDRPFFADRLFANRLINHVDALKIGAQQNKIYIFEGPHGSGKSTFLNNLLKKFEEYANTPEGNRYEVVWRLNRKMIHHNAMIERILSLKKFPSSSRLPAMKPKKTFSIMMKRSLPKRTILKFPAQVTTIPFFSYQNIFDADSLMMSLKTMNLNGNSLLPKSMNGYFAIIPVLSAAPYFRPFMIHSTTHSAYMLEFMQGPIVSIEDWEKALVFSTLAMSR